MKTCIICHVTQATECFEATRNQCKVCYNTRALQRYYRMRRTIDGRLRQLYQGCKERHKSHRGELITFERFDAIFHAQDGVCVETGIPFVLQSKDLMPSPDRIDNDAGYIDGNIRFVTWRINNMRKNMSTTRFHSTCMEVVEPNARILVVQPDNMARVKKMYSRCRDRHNGLAGRRKKKYGGELITFERFETIYNAQGGVCVETGVPFDWESELMPSPDRIDNAVGYLDGNLRFVTWRINRMRGGLSVEDFHTTCSQLTHHNSLFEHTKIDLGDLGKPNDQQKGLQPSPTQQATKQAPSAAYDGVLDEPGPAKT